MKRITVAAFVILCCTACRHRGEGGVLLRLKYDIGANIDVKYRAYVITDNENDDPIKNEYIRMGFTVDSVMNDSLYVLSAKIDYVRVKNKGFMNDENYSSDKDEADMGPKEKELNREFKPVLDSTYKLTINNRGQLIKPLSFACGRKIPKAFAPIDYEIYQVVFPRERVAIGDEWTNERPQPGNF